MTTIIIRGGTAATAPPGLILEAGEPAAERDTGRVKIGDGVTAWAALEYSDERAFAHATAAAAAAQAAAIAAVVNGAPAGGDTLVELHNRLAAIEGIGSLATDAEVIAQVVALVGGAPADRDTLGELGALMNLRLLAANNLGDVPNAVTARGNLGVYSTAQVDAATALLLTKAGNLGDLANLVTARGNLGVYSTAQVDAAVALQLSKAGNLAGMADYAAARANLSVYSQATINARLTSGMGTLAARPLAGAVAEGAIYFATDDDGGTVWQVIAGAWQQLAPGLTETSGVELARMELFDGDGVIQTAASAALTDVVFAAATFQINFATGARPANVVLVGIGASTQAGGGGRIAINDVAGGRFEDTIGDAGAANSWFPFRVEMKIAANQPARNYKVQIANRVGGTFSLGGLANRTVKLYATTC